MEHETEHFNEFVIEKAGDQFSFKKESAIEPVYFIALASNSKEDHGVIYKSYLIDKSNTERKGLQDSLAEVTEYSIHLTKTLTARERQINDLNIYLQRLLEENNSLKRSVFYRAHTLGLNGCRILFNQGLKQLLIATRRKIRTQNVAYNVSARQKKVVEQENQKTENLAQPDNERELQNQFDAFLSQPDNRLIFPQYPDPVVSIIILTYNKASFTYACLKSILEHTDTVFEVIIVDNGSIDATSELRSRLDNTLQINNNENQGFIRGCNQGAARAKGRYLLFLNNDTIVTKGWLSLLVSTIENYPKCGAVGCKLVWPNGKLQEAGSIIWKDGSATGYGRGDDPLKPEYSYVREVDFVSGACLLTRSDLFIKLHGFDERYIPAYYEDADLCLGVKNLGYSIIYQPGTTIFHNEYTSSNKENAKKHMIKNQTKFVDKWKSVLETKEINSPHNVLKARDTRKVKNILYIDDRIPASSQGCGYPRANRILTFLGEAGDRVTFFPLADITPWQPYTYEFQQGGIEVFYGNFIDFFAFAKERENFYDIVLVSRPHNFEITKDTIQRFFPNALIIYDAEALFSTREILKAQIDGSPLNETQIQRLRSREFDLLTNADIIITVSDNERKIILDKISPEKRSLRHQPSDRDQR